MDQAYPLKESEENNLYTILEVLEVWPEFLGETIEKEDDPSSELLDRHCPFCGAGNADTTLCIERLSLFGQE